MEPRGVRNHNPLNIVIGNDWLGEDPVKRDSRFEVFTSDVYGFRAAFILFYRYIHKYQRNTIRRIVYAWCPDETAASYVHFVCSRLGHMSPDQVLLWEDEGMMVKLAGAMAHLETGRVYDESVITRAYLMARDKFS